MYRSPQCIIILAIIQQYSLPIGLQSHADYNLLGVYKLYYYNRSEKSKIIYIFMVYIICKIMSRIRILLLSRRNVDNITLLKLKILKTFI